VEKTAIQVMAMLLLKKHLHVRGEDDIPASRVMWKSETPPRAWRRRFVLAEGGAGSRNTSTGVEKT